MNRNTKDTLSTIVIVLFAMSMVAISFYWFFTI